MDPLPPEGALSNGAALLRALHEHAPPPPGGDDDSPRDDTRVVSAIHNFCALRRGLARLGVPLTPGDAGAIIAGEAGAGAALLLRLRSALPAAAAAAAAEGAPRGLGALADRTKPAAYEAATASAFDRALRALPAIGRQTDLNYAPQAGAWEAAGAAAQAVRDAALAAAGAHAAAGVQLRRRATRAALERTRAASAQRDAAGHSAWARHMATRRASVGACDAAHDAGAHAAAQAAAERAGRTARAVAGLSAGAAPCLPEGWGRGRGVDTDELDASVTAELRALEERSAAERATQRRRLLDGDTTTAAPCTTPPAWAPPPPSAAEARLLAREAGVWEWARNAVWEAAAVEAEAQRAAAAQRAAQHARQRALYADVLAQRDAHVAAGLRAHTAALAELAAAAHAGALACVAGVLHDAVEGAAAALELRQGVRGHAGPATYGEGGTDALHGVGALPVWGAGPAASAPAAREAALRAYTGLLPPWSLDVDALTALACGAPVASMLADAHPALKCVGAASAASSSALGSLLPALAAGGDAGAGAKPKRRPAAPAAPASPAGPPSETLAGMPMEDAPMARWEEAALEALGVSPPLASAWDAEQTAVLARARETGHPLAGDPALQWALASDACAAAAILPAVVATAAAAVAAAVVAADEGARLTTSSEPDLLPSLLLLLLVLPPGCSRQQRALGDAVASELGMAHCAVERGWAAEEGVVEHGDAAEVGAVVSRLAEAAGSGVVARGVVLSGFPRNARQAALLATALGGSAAPTPRSGLLLLPPRPPPLRRCPIGVGLRVEATPAEQLRELLGCVVGPAACTPGDEPPLDAPAAHFHLDGSPPPPDYCAVHRLRYMRQSPAWDAADATAATDDAADAAAAMAADALAAGRAVAAQDAALPELLRELRGLSPLPPRILVESATLDGGWLPTAQLALRLAAVARAGWDACERVWAAHTAQRLVEEQSAYAGAAARALAQAAVQRACSGEGEAARGLLAAADTDGKPAADAVPACGWGVWAPPTLPLSPPVLALVPLDVTPAVPALDASAAGTATGASIPTSADRAPSSALARIHTDWRGGGDAELATALASAAAAMAAAERALAAELGASGTALRAWLDTPPLGLCDALAQLGAAGDTPTGVEAGACRLPTSAEVSAVRARAAAHIHAATARLNEACTARAAPALVTACRAVHAALTGVMAAQSGRLLDARAALFEFYSASVGASGEELLSGVLAPRGRAVAPLEPSVVRPAGAALGEGAAEIGVVTVAPPPATAAAKPLGARGGRSTADVYRDDVSDSLLAALLASLPLRPSLAAFDGGGGVGAGAATHRPPPSPTAHSVGSASSARTATVKPAPARPRREPVAVVNVDAAPSAAGNVAARPPAPRQRKLKADAAPAADPSAPNHPWPPPLWDDGATAAAVAATAAGMPTLQDSALCRSAEGAVRLADAVEAQAVALLLRQTRGRAQRVCRERAALEQAMAALRADESRAAKARPPAPASKGPSAPAAPPSAAPARPPPVPTAELLARAIAAGALEAAHGDASDAPPCPPFDVTLVVALRYEARCLRLAAVRLLVHAAAFSCRAAALARQGAACSAAAVAAAQRELVGCVDVATACAALAAPAAASTRPCIRPRRAEEARTSGVAAHGLAGFVCEWVER